MHLTTFGLVLREVQYKESDKILTLLTQDMGKITATARGCRKKGSLISASCQQLILSQFVLYEYRGKWAVKEASMEREFKHIHEDYKRFSLACYFSQVCELLALEDFPQDTLLALILNCLHVLDQKQEIPLSMAKAVFELRAVCQSGYEPLLDACSFCGTPNPNTAQFHLQGGSIHCKSCGRKEFPLSDASLSALRFVSSSEDKKIFSFSLSPSQNFEEICEAYLLAQLDHHFPALSFYKKI